MSSTAYSAKLKPDPFLRRVALCVGVVLLVAGGIAIVTMKIPVWLRVVGILPWSVLVSWELRRLHGCWGTYTGMSVLADGGVRLRDKNGDWHEAELLPGSVLLSAAGWIRLKTASGPAFAEPVRESWQNCNDWRRLQVIWRHVGAPG